MIKFGFNDYQTEFPNWSKHHRFLSVLAKRVYKDGETVLPESDLLNAIVVDHKDKLKKKHVRLYDRKTFETREAIDYFLPLRNLEYKEADLDYYSVGASNTKQTTSIRLTFLLGYDTFILDYQFKGEGSFATTFKDVIDIHHGIEEMIEDVVDKELGVAEVGIERGEEGDYHIAVKTSTGAPFSFDIERDELLNSLISVEIYEFEHEIVT